MMYREKFGSRLFDGLNYMFMLLLVVVMTYPIIHVLAISLSSATAIQAGKVGWLPKGLNFEGYKYVLARPDLWVAYKNTVFYAAGSTFFTLLFTSLLAYPLSVKAFAAGKIVMIYVVVTMFISGGLIPTFLLIKELHLLNTFWVMVLPGAVGAFNVIIFRTFFQNIPNDFRESAYMDGANDVGILFRIYMPLSKPLLATFALFTIVANWNEWFSALIYLKDPGKFPIQMLLRKILILEDVTGATFSQAANVLREQNISPKNIQMAVATIAMLPILCVYPFVQRFFVKGIMIGAVKG